MTISAEQVREWYDYSPDSGLFTRRVQRKSRPSGSVLAGTLNHGYLRIMVAGRSYSLHRLAFLWMTGHWPSADIDHIDGDRTNNRWSNLRDVDRSTNLQNMRIAKSHNKSTGILGAYLHKKTGRYTSRIRSCGRNVHLGMFDTPQEAHAAYVAAKRQLHEGGML